jgi:ATP-dependent DNA helicase RecQ
LRALRLEIAHSRRVPPYVVFHDTPLRELARLQPVTLDDLRHVYGIGARKADDFGRDRARRHPVRPRRHHITASAV